MAVIGIDLGTTFSAVAHVDAYGRAEVLDNADGEKITPSVVYFEDAHSQVVGTAAKHSFRADPDNVLETVKHEMGQDISWEFHGESFTPEQVSAVVLKRLVADAEESLGRPVEGAVITVPAIFGDAERNATLNAARIAGLPVLSLIAEPVAAAVAYGFGGEDPSRTRDGTLLIYDLGGGTFDLTVLRIRDGHFEMLATDGDRRLGGTDWDKAVVDYVAARFLEETDGAASDPREDPVAYYTLLYDAEEAKRALTRKEKHAVFCQHDGKRARVELTRDTFERITAHLLQQTADTTRLVLDRLVRSGRLPGGWAEIDQVLLVGGSTRMPQVARMLHALAGKPPESLDVDLVVAQGAALYAAMKAAQGARPMTVPAADAAPRTPSAVEDDRPTVASVLGQEGAPPPAATPDLSLPPAVARALAGARVTQVSSFALGIAAYDEQGRVRNDVLIPMNAPLPTLAERTYVTSVQYQSEVGIRVYEGGDPLLENCILLGEGVIRNLPPGLPQGSTIEVRIGLTEESLIQVEAIEPLGMRRCSFDLRRATGLSEAQVEAARERLAAGRVG